jgi:hypothetical protein
MGRPLIAPPGLYPRSGTALRKTFAEAMRDPQPIAEGAKMDLELGFVSGVDVQALVERLSPPEVMARAQAPQIFSMEYRAWANRGWKARIRRRHHVWLCI